MNLNEKIKQLEKEALNRINAKKIKNYLKQ